MYNKKGAKESPLLSIIIPVYNTGKYIEKCINSVIKQTYENLEIIVVNDKSPDDAKQIILQYAQLDSRIKYVENEKNEGLYQARLNGYLQATGEFIASLDSDDYVGEDYYRCLMQRILETDSDIVISNFVTDNLETNEKKMRTYGVYALQNLILEGAAIQQAYFETDAEISIWWFVWNKIYKKSLWDQCYPYLCKLQRHHIMLEDFIYGTIFLTNAQKVVTTECNNHFYVRHPEASTGSAGGIKKIEKNVDDIIGTFQFLDKYNKFEYKNSMLEDFLEKAKVRWKRTWITTIKKTELDLEDTLRLEQRLMGLCEKMWDETPSDRDAYFYWELSKYNSDLEDIKLQLRNTELKYLAIDIFDVLLLKMVGSNFSLYMKMERELKADKKITNFAIKRKCAESEIVEKLKRIEGDMDSYSINQIYKELMKQFNLNSDEVEYLKQLEVDCYIKVSRVRGIIIELIEYARAIGKEIVWVADTPYSRVDVVRILSDKGISASENIFVSNEYGHTLKEGKLVKDILRKLECEEEELFIVTGKRNAGKDIFKKVKSIFIDSPKTQIKQRYSKWNNHVTKRSLTEILNLDMQYNELLEDVNQCIANKMFENPWSGEVNNTIYDANPYLIGYGALGSHVMSVSVWIMKQAVHSKRIVFINKETDIFAEAIALLDIKGEYSIGRIDISDSMLVMGYVDGKYSYEIMRLMLKTCYISAEIIYKELNLQKYVDEEAFRIGVMEQSILLQENILQEKVLKRFKEGLIAVLSQRGLSEIYAELQGEGKEDYAAVFFGIKNYSYYLAGRTLHYCMLGSGEYQNAQIRSYYDKKIMVDYPIREKLYKRILLRNDREESVDVGSFHIEKFVFGNIRKGAIDFIKDIFSLYGENISSVNWEASGLSLAFEYFIHFPKDNERKLFTGIDLVDIKKNSLPIRKLSNIWWDYLESNKLLWKDNIKEKENNNIKEVSKKQKNTESKKEENKSLDLNKINRWQRVGYYMFFNTEALYYKMQKFPSARYLMKPFYLVSQKITGMSYKRDKILYIATSNYNLLSCLVHKMLYHKDEYCVLMLSEWRKEKKDIIKQLGLFDEVVISKDNRFRNLSSKISEDYLKATTEAERKYWIEFFYDQFTEELPVRLYEYKKIYATNTIMPITVLLQKLNIKYDCFEEAGGLYSDNTLLMNNMYNFHPKVEIGAIEKYKMKDMFRVKGRRFINCDVQKGGYPKKNVVDFNIISLLKSMEYDTRKLILEVFGCKEVENGESGDVCLLLSYPLVTRSGLTLASHLTIYTLLADIFAPHMAIHLKPHPDDKVNYKGKLSEFNIINKQVLSELLEFETKTIYKKAIATVSTSTNNLQNAKEKIAFGYLFEKEYINLLPYYCYYRILSKISEIERYNFILHDMYNEMFENICNYTEGEMLNINKTNSVLERVDLFFNTNIKSLEKNNLMIYMLESEVLVEGNYRRIDVNIIGEYEHAKNYSIYIDRRFVKHNMKFDEVIDMKHSKLQVVLKEDIVSERI